MGSVAETTFLSPVDGINTKTTLESPSLAIANKSLSSQKDQAPEENTLRREMKFRHAFSFVVGCMVGAGIFVTPSLIAQRTPNLFVSLLAWIVAGLVALIGALCYCEMASIVKKTGSSYVFILDCYGPAAGFLVNWANVFLFAPCDACILLLTIGLYACAPFYEDHTSPEYQWMSKLVGIVIMLCISVIHCLGAKKSGIFQMVFMAIQMLVFATIVGLGIYSLSARNTYHHFETNIVFNNTLNGLSDEFPSFGIALFNALYCFDGYVTIAFIVEEVINPSKAVPLLSFTSIPFVTFLYILINLACAAVLTHKEIATSNVFLSDVAFKIGGESLSYVVPFAVSICVVPALSAVFYNLPRLMMSAAREGQFPRFFALIHRERRTPIPSVIFLAIVSTVLTLLNLELQSMLQICNIVIWFEYAFAVSTILVNRWRKPNMKRAYKTWLITPIIMIVIPLILLILAIMEKSFITILILVLMMLGLPVYFVCLKKRWISSRLNQFVYRILVNNTNLVECKINCED
ncbi:b(0,+)-type amino acid transporter 1-like [Clytia hemisphaerica]|uniref:Uncharacterized protein n=1 Tax=Clytia hemisphaerica TaxID=252671 RepID=A0A7M5XEE5_9CNID